MFDRKKQLKWASLKVGVVITLTLLIIFFVVVFSGGIQDLLKEKTSLNIYIEDVKGLRKGAPVRVAGIDVGTVKEIKLSKEHGVVVKVSIEKEVLEYLKSDAKATVQTIGLLGDKYIEIFPGNSQEKFDVSKGLYGYPQTEIREIITVATSTMTKIEGLIQRVDSLITKIENSQGSIAKLINDPSLYNNLNSLVLDLKKTLEEIKSGSIGMIARDEELYQRLSNTLKNFEETSKKIYTQQGTLGKIINDPSLYESLLRSSQKLDNFLQEIERSEGTLKLLISDKTLADELKQSIIELRSLIEEIKKNPKKFFKFSIF
ncbi:MAG: MlaD family protein [Thermodesulfovibrio sp.]|nr:MlaD family protein [Thermodesulfovibrio sp.]MCX7724213.1 MlaD family protein [Thermodesulfovibrio sp.]MDW7972622.1 MlaD family protein [Thermodesulfovibrio sp.]